MAGYFIQTSFESRTEYIFIEELTLENYLNACGQMFHINFEVKHDVQLFNQNHAKIGEHHFEQVVKCFCQSASFCIHLCATPQQSDMPLITPKDLQMFLMQRHCGDILEKGRDAETVFTESDRKTLITHAHAYLALKCKTIEKRHIVLVAKTLVTLVPKLKDSSGGDHAGYENMLQYLSKKVSNCNYTAGKRAKKGKKSDSIENVESLTDKLNLLKTLVVANDNVELIKTILTDTAQLRSQMVKKTKIDFLEQFPMFFTHPEFILHDFTTRFPEANSAGFIENWPLYASNIKRILRDSYKQTIHTMWPDDVEQLLVVLKLLPAKAGQKRASGVLPFGRAIDKLIVHTKMPKPTQKELDKNIYPRIIACGPTSENVTHFFIAVEDQLISLPPEWTILQVFDLFFKIHMVLDISFEMNISPTMIFFGHFFYNLKTKEFKATVSMTNLRDKFPA